MKNACMFLQNGIFKAGTHVINDSGLPCLKCASIQVEYYEFGLMVCVWGEGGVRK